MCEGVEDYEFARRALVRMGWNKRQIEPRICPRGKGSGEQYVRERYPHELRAQRARQGVILLVVTDADRYEVSERLRQLDEALKGAGQPRRGRDEQVTIWIPRRHLETWIYFYAHGGPVDESSRTGYKFKVKEADFALAAQRFGNDLKRRVAPPHACQSLVAAFAENERIRSRAGRPSRSRASRKRRPG
ncbi:MAG TPA: hypothetical protein VNM90_00800 [Haliangium sp.]|nr:hypothetical protein [Haliangium sp.]